MISMVYEWVNGGRRRLIVRVPDALRLDTARGRELAWLGVPERVRALLVGGVFENEYHRAGRWAIFRVTVRHPYAVGRGK